MNAAYETYCNCSGMKTYTRIVNKRSVNSSTATYHIADQMAPHKVYASIASSLSILQIMGMTHGQILNIVHWAMTGTKEIKVFSQNSLQPTTAQYYDQQHVYILAELEQQKTSWRDNMMSNYGPGEQQQHCLTISGRIFLQAETKSESAVHVQTAQPVSAPAAKDMHVKGARTIFVRNRSRDMQWHVDIASTSHSEARLCQAQY